MNNQFGEGASCQVYSGYTGSAAAWFNGEWCNANIVTCADARAHQGTLPGYGASRAACASLKLAPILSCKDICNAKECGNDCPACQGTGGGRFLNSAPGTPGNACNGCDATVQCDQVLTPSPTLTPTATPTAPSRCDPSSSCGKCMANGNNEPTCTSFGVDCACARTASPTPKPTPSPTATPTTANPTAVPTDSPTAPCPSGTAWRQMTNADNEVSWVCHCHAPPPTEFTVVGSWMSSKEIPYIGPTESMTKTWTTSVTTSNGRSFTGAEATTLLHSQASSQASTTGSTTTHETSHGTKDGTSHSTGTGGGGGGYHSGGGGGGGGGVRYYSPPPPPTSFLSSVGSAAEWGLKAVAGGVLSAAGGALFAMLGRRQLTTTEVEFQLFSALGRRELTIAQHALLRRRLQASKTSGGYSELFRTSKDGSSSSDSRTREYKSTEQQGVETTYSSTLNTMTGTTHSVSRSITFHPTSPPSTRYLWWYTFFVFNEWCEPIYEIPTKQYAFTTRSTIAPKCLMTGDLICEDLNNCVKCVGSAPKKVCSDQAGAKHCSSIKAKGLCSSAVRGACEKTCGVCVCKDEASFCDSAIENGLCDSIGARCKRTCGVDCTDADWGAATTPGQAATDAAGSTACPSCSSYAELTKCSDAVTVACCDGTGEKCDSGNPKTCDAECAKVLLPMQAHCADFLSHGMFKPMKVPLDAAAAKCTAPTAPTVQACPSCTSTTQFIQCSDDVKAHCCKTAADKCESSMPETCDARCAVHLRAMQASCAAFLSSGMFKAMKAPLDAAAAKCPALPGTPSRD